MMANQVAKRKVVIFIVEGNTDKTALEMIFKKIYTYQEIKFEFMRGDITSDETSTIQNVADKVYGKVKDCMKYGKFERNDIWSIVQIFDTDGAYIPDEAIVQGNVPHFQYTTTHITAKDRRDVVARNARKSALMDYLVTCDAIKSIPYKGYFMSSNLDHGLYNKQNLTDKDKERYAVFFYKIFEGKEKAFIAFLNKEVAKDVPDSYIQSWNYIREGVRSLERHTNLHTYFTQNIPI